MQEAQDEAHFERQLTCKSRRGIEVPVLDEDGIRLTAFWTRTVCGLTPSQRFDPLDAMERIIPIADPGFCCKIIEKTIWLLGEDVHAAYLPEQNTILVREDVYERAFRGSKGDLMTIAHEVSHYVQFLIMRIFSSLPFLELKTASCTCNCERLRHETQTDRITALLFTPAQLVAGKSDKELFWEYIATPLAALTIKAAWKVKRKHTAEKNAAIKKEVLCVV